MLPERLVMLRLFQSPNRASRPSDNIGNAHTAETCHSFNPAIGLPGLLTVRMVGAVAMNGRFHTPITPPSLLTARILSVYARSKGTFHPATRLAGTLAVALLSPSC